MPCGGAPKSVRASAGPIALYFAHADGILMRRQKGPATRFLRCDGKNPAATRSTQTEMLRIDNIHYVNSNTTTVHVHCVQCDAKTLAVAGVFQQYERPCPLGSPRRPGRLRASKCPAVAGRGRYWIVRRQNIWHNSRRKLAECGPRPGVDIKRRSCGGASGDVRWSSV